MALYKCALIDCLINIISNAYARWHRCFQRRLDSTTQYWPGLIVFCCHTRGLVWVMSEIHVSFSTVCSNNYIYREFQNDTCQYKRKMRSEIRIHCALAIIVRRSQKISIPPHTPFPGAQESQNLISWRWSLPLPTDPVWWGSMHVISSYRGNRATHTPTHRQDRLQYTTPQVARSVISHNMLFWCQI